MAFKRGSGFKNKNNKIISELNAIGYTANNVHKLIGCSQGKGYILLKTPAQLKISQVQAICYALNKSFGYVLNSLFSTPKDSPNWLSEDYNPVEHINKLKQS